MPVSHPALLWSCPSSTDMILSFDDPQSLWIICAVYLASVNLAVFFMMWSDKRRAKERGAHRIPERRFFLLALLGGSPGAIISMQMFRHKTKHWYFVLGMPLILVAQLAAVMFLLIYA